MGFRRPTWNSISQITVERRRDQKDFDTENAEVELRTLIFFSGGDNPRDSVTLSGLRLGRMFGSRPYRISSRALFALS
jgi:cyanophycinase-like exopeptidase